MLLTIPAPRARSGVRPAAPATAGDAPRCAAPASAASSALRPASFRSAALTLAAAFLRAGADLGAASFATGGASGAGSALLIRNAENVKPAAAAASSMRAQTSGAALTLRTLPGISCPPAVIRSAPVLHAATAAQTLRVIQPRRAPISAARVASALTLSRFARLRGFLGSRVSALELGERVGVAGMSAAPTPKRRPAAAVTPRRHLRALSPSGASVRRPSL